MRVPLEAQFKIDGISALIRIDRNSKRIGF